MTSFLIEVGSESETRQLAQQCASQLENGDLIILEGALGAGKTYFVKFVSEYFKYDGLVNSPTFNIANFYETANQQLIHLDLYRIETVDEFFNLGLTEFFPDAISFMEWGTKVSEYFDEFIHIKIEHDSKDKHKRIFNFSAKGKAEKLAKLRTLLQNN